MDLRDCIREAMCDLPDTEKMIVLSVMIDTLMDRVSELRKEVRFIRNIPISKIDPYQNHPFYVVDDEDMMNLARSINKYGLLTPCIVRIKEDDRYELLAGHRRLRACQLAGLGSISCEVRNLTDEEASVLMVETNRQRTNLHPVEKGKVYKFWQETRSSGISSDEKVISLDAKDSMKRIQQLIHLGDLIPEIKEMVDNGQISLSPATEMSYLPVRLQKTLRDSMEYEQCSPTHSQVRRMRKLNAEGTLTPEIIEQIMGELKPNQKERLVLSDEQTLARIPKDIPVSRQEEYVARALEFYRKHGGNDGKTYRK